MTIFAQNLKQMEYNTSLFLDTRRAKENGSFPIKLRVYSTQLQLKKLYATKYEMTIKEFHSIWETLKPRKENQETRDELQAILTRANEVCKTLQPFSFTQFEKRYLRNTGEGNNIVYQYDSVIEKLNQNNCIGTASNYDLSLKSLLNFIEHSKGKRPVKVAFSEITPEWLQKYENYMVQVLGRSKTTVGIYLRPLRAVFNNAIAEKEIDFEIYPFGAKKYQIPTGRNTKNALSQEDLKKLFDATPNTDEQAKAKDFWFFSYACNGMNIKDIALLKNEDLQDDKIIFHRAKTINTSKADSRPITVYLNDFSKSIIKKYRNSEIKKVEYLFPILTNQETETLKHNKTKNFTKFINQNIKKLALSKGITGDISTYWARHSFATNSIRNGASMEFVMEALNHSNMKTTKGYFAGFEDKTKKEFMQKLMDF